jgi:peptide/nickel transport system substrate-binding protein
MPVRRPFIPPAVACLYRRCSKTGLRKGRLLDARRSDKKRPQAVNGSAAQCVAHPWRRAAKGGNMTISSVPIERGPSLRNSVLRLTPLVATLLLGTAVLAAEPDVVPATTPPDAPVFSEQTSPHYVEIKDILVYKALPAYHEPAWVTKQFVDTGKLPPVQDRLPKEPMVYLGSNMADGIGVYGDVMRHVIGGRPEGWNYQAGQAQGWGGVDIGMFECLTRSGPLFQIKAEALEPMPNLAKSWEWSTDGHQLTMHLIEGAKWSDGVPFTSEDVMFYWQDNLLDRNVTPTNGATPETFGEGTTLKAMGDYTVVWTFKDAFPKNFLYAMAYGTFCPGPAHMLKPQHPKFSSNTYDQFRNAFPPTFLNYPVMGAWVPVTYRSDDIIVLRRNPYYWKVDSDGNQLPYLDELQYRLSTWADRDVQAAAGTGDYSNLEQPESYVEALKRSAEADAPARLAFGQRTIGYTLYPNLSANGWGQPDARGQAVRELNRNLDFRKAISYAIDRQSLGNSLAKGPFTSIYPGGLYAGTPYYDKASTVYYPFSVESAKAELKAAGLVDTDGDGYVNFPKDTKGVGGQNVQLVVLGDASIVTDRDLMQGIVAQLQRVGIQAIQKSIQGPQLTAAQSAGQFDWRLTRNTGGELITAVQNTTALAPVGPQTSIFHHAGTDGTVDLLPYEKGMVDLVNAFITDNDQAKRLELMKQYQKLYTENVNGVGLTQFSAALVVNKRFANVPPGTPNFMYNWGEDSIMRERLFVPLDKQKGYELYPHQLPGIPGLNNGPVSQ